MQQMISLLHAVQSNLPRRGMVSRHEEQKASRHDAKIGVLAPNGLLMTQNNKNNAMMGNNIKSLFHFGLPVKNPFQSVGLCSSSVEEVVGCSAL